MEIKYGLISCDSHAQLHKDAWKSRMSHAKWADRIPHVVEVQEEGFDYPVERWRVNGKVRGDAVCNCPAAMSDSLEGRRYPQRWEEVPAKVYDPAERLRALDSDGVDGEVLFPNTPVQGGFSAQGDAAYELACVQAYNDALAEWRRVSDRYIPLAILPYLSPIETIVSEVERAVRSGHRGIDMVAEPALAMKGLPRLPDPCWNPLWATCQDLGVPIHWHGSAGLAAQLSLPRWKGFNRDQSHTVSTARLCSTSAQLIPNLIFSGILERYPRLKWVCAETGLGWVSYVLEACDHEWQRRHLWTHGLATRPSDLFRRQIYVDFWYETAGIELRHTIGLDNIMWESDYPHIASTYPQSWKFVERTLSGVPPEERPRLLYENAYKLYWS